MIAITLLFITCISGVIQEVRTLLHKETDKSIRLLYAFGSIFFLFWHEPFINLGLIWFLFIFSIIDIFATKSIQRLNSVFCLVVIIGLIINFILYYI